MTATLIWEVLRDLRTSCIWNIKHKTQTSQISNQQTHLHLENEFEYCYKPNPFTIVIDDLVLMVQNPDKLQFTSRKAISVDRSSISK